MTPDLTPVPGATPRYDDDGREIVDVATCGTCGRSWNDAASSSVTPAPSGRCPFEYEHPGARLEYLRAQIRAECISMGEVVELQGLAAHIEPGDVELLEWAGVPEHEEEAALSYRFEIPEMGLTISVDRSTASDHAPVIFIDTDERTGEEGPLGPKIRVNVNDGEVF
jgi:hypothetical protein